MHNLGKGASPGVAHDCSVRSHARTGSGWAVSIGAERGFSGVDVKGSCRTHLPVKISSCDHFDTLVGTGAMPEQALAWH